MDNIFSLGNSFYGPLLPCQSCTAYRTLPQLHCVSLSSLSLPLLWVRCLGERVSRTSHARLGMGTRTLMGTQREPGNTESITHAPGHLPDFPLLQFPNHRPVSASVWGKTELSKCRIEKLYVSKTPQRANTVRNSMRTKSRNLGSKSEE